MKPEIFSCLIAAFILGITGCAPSENVADINNSEQEYRTVTDHLGREVNVQEEIEHVGSLFAVASHIVAMLGESESIVTITQGNMRDLLFCEIYPSIKKARVAKGGNTANIEEVAKKPRPDLLLVNPEIALDAGQMRQLQKLRAPIVTISYNSIEEQIAMVRLIGNILGRTEKAEAYADYYAEVIELATSRTADIPDNERKTVYHSINELLRVDQKDTLSEDWINYVGVKNVAFSKTGNTSGLTSKNYMSIEELLEKNPDFIIINGGDVLDYINRSSQLHNLKAYQNGNIHLLPLGVTRWGHPYSIETPLAMLWTAKTIYPERFEDIDIEQRTRDFYRTFFDYNLSDAQLAKILSGRGYKKIKGSGH